MYATVENNERENNYHESPSDAPGAVSTAVVIGGCGAM